MLFVCCFKILEKISTSLWILRWDFHGKIGG